MGFKLTAILVDHSGILQSKCLPENWDNFCWCLNIRQNINYNLKSIEIYLAIWETFWKHWKFQCFVCFSHCNVCKYGEKLTVNQWQWAMMDTSSQIPVNRTNVSPIPLLQGRLFLSLLVKLWGRLSAVSYLLLISSSAKTIIVLLKVDSLLVSGGGCVGTSITLASATNLLTASSVTPWPWASTAGPQPRY